MRKWRDQIGGTATPSGPGDRRHDRCNLSTPEATKGLGLAGRGNTAKDIFVHSVFASGYGGVSYEACQEAGQGEACGDEDAFCWRDGKLGW
jgi:hypothetical protein